MEAGDILGFDNSFDYLTEAEHDCLAAGGYRIHMQCGYTGIARPLARVPNLTLVRDKGVMTNVLYISLPQNAQPGTGAYHMEQGLAGIPDDILASIQMVAVDVELPGITAAAIRESLEYLKNRGWVNTPGGPARLGIYTSLNAWNNYVVFDAMNTPTSFTDVWLLNAFWDWAQDRDFERFPYGGWAPWQVICEQYTGGDIPECGQTLDRDVWNLRLFQGEPPQEDDMDTNLRKIQAAGAFFDKASAVIRTTNPEQVKTLAEQDPQLAAVIYYLLTGKAFGTD